MQGTLRSEWCKTVGLELDLKLPPNPNTWQLLHTLHDNYSAAKDKILGFTVRTKSYSTGSAILSEHNNMDISPSIPLANSSCACDRFGTGSCSEPHCYQQLDFIPYLDLSSTMSPLAQELDTSSYQHQRQQQLIDCKFWCPDCKVGSLKIPILKCTAKMLVACWLVLMIEYYPTMYYIGNPRHTQSMIAYMFLTEYFWIFQKKVALWECC